MNDFVITLDVDWAPDYMIDFVAERLERHSVRSTAKRLWNCVPVA